MDVEPVFGFLKDHLAFTRLSVSDKKRICIHGGELENDHYREKL